MNLQELVLYVELDVDDSFDTIEITRWFNKGIAQYNLIPPVTTYPFVELTGLSTDTNAVSEKIYVDEAYPLDDTFMLGVMLPYINSAVRSQDSSLQEKQLFLAEFISAAQIFKPQSNVPLTYLKDKKNTDLEIFQLGNNVYVSDMTRSPFTNSWSSHAVYAEVTSSVDVVFYDAQLSADSRKAARLAMGSRLSEFMTEAGVTGTIYSDVNLTQAIPASTIITSSAVYYYA
ncbi:MAG: hypothetical protein EBY39_03315 [Flavobacteriia bacterium]|nr:hypothetical protein [Flavobacteriia bacterium]